MFVLFPKILPFYRVFLSFLNSLSARCPDGHLVCLCPLAPSFPSCLHSEWKWAVTHPDVVIKLLHSWLRCIVGIEGCRCSGQCGPLWIYSILISFSPSVLLCSSASSFSLSQTAISVPACTGLGVCSVLSGPAHCTESGTMDYESVMMYNVSVMTYDVAMMMSDKSVTYGV